MRRPSTVLAIAMALCAGGSVSEALLLAQESDSCAFLCAPEFKIEPTITAENIFGPARLEFLDDDQSGTEPVRQGRETVFEFVLATVIPTDVPRVGFTVETIFAPFLDDTGVELELEANLTWLDAAHTGGWVESHFDIVDKFSPAARPDDTSSYTHKLNFELDTAVLLFKWMSGDSWLRGVELEGSLDYVATGLPRAGDVIENVRFLDDASKWSASLVFVLPLAPLAP